MYTYRGRYMSEISVWDIGRPFQWRAVAVGFFGEGTEKQMREREGAARLSLLGQTKKQDK
jgi:hypothetical protein